MTEQSYKTTSYPYLRVMLIACAGIAFSLLLYWDQNSGHEALVNAILEEHTQEHSHAIEAEIRRNFFAIKSIKNLYDSSENVTRKEFNDFTMEISVEMKSIQALEWIPRVLNTERAAYEKSARDEGFKNFNIREVSSEGEMVRAGDREEYYPVYYLNPMKGNEKALGFDLNSNRKRKDVLSKARDTGKMVVAEPVTLVQEKGESLGLLAFMPVYKKDIDTFTTEDRRRGIAGFALGVYRINDLIKNSLKGFHDAGLKLQVSDITDRSAPRHLATYFEGDILEKKDVLAMPPEDNMESLSSTLNVLGRQWEIQTIATPAFKKSLPPNHSALFLIGSLILASLISYVYSLLITRTSTLNNLVAIRTSELDESKNLLEKKVEERTRELAEYNERLEIIVADKTKEIQNTLFKIEQSKDRIDAIIKYLGEGLLVTDDENKIILVNESAEYLLDTDMSNLEGKSLESSLLASQLKTKILNTFKNNSGFDFDFTINKEDVDGPDKTIYLRAKTALIKNKHDEKSGVVTVFHDVSREREIDRIKTEFVSTAAHELRTPLTTILGYSELLLSEDDISDEEHDIFLGYINKQSKRLASILNDLLNVSRMESGKGLELKRERCNGGEAAITICDQFAKVTTTHKIKCIQPKDPAYLFVDKEKMMQVLSNLLSNAIKYSPEGGVITMTGEIDEGNYLLSVSDEGIGMTKEQLSNVFKKFYRVNSSETAPEGTGLGMTIVENIIKAHGGKIWMESEIGKGTKVTFSIPLFDENMSDNSDECVKE